jgi:hypothetical protein
MQQYFLLLFCYFEYLTRRQLVECVFASLHFWKIKRKGGLASFQQDKKGKNEIHKERRN